MATRTAGGLSTLALALALAGCAEPPCEAGQRWDDRLEGCVPDSCGEGGWGGLDDAGGLRVAPWGADDGDGSAEAPLAGVQAALDLAASSGPARVLLAAGVYDEHLALDHEHDGVQLHGRCRELVTLRATDERASLEVAGAQVTVTGLALEGGRVGVALIEGEREAGLELRRFAVRDALELGVLLQGDVSALLDEGAIRGTRALGDAWGLGLLAANGAQLDGRYLELTENTEAGLVAAGAGTAVELVWSGVSGTLPSADGGYGRGLAAVDGASLYGASLLVEDNAGFGVFAAHSGTEVELRASEVTGASVLPEGIGGIGLQVQEGALLVGDGLVLADNEVAGFVVVEGGAELELSASEVRDNRARGGEDEPCAASVETMATLWAEDVAFSGQAGCALLAVGDGASARLVDCSIRDGRAGPEGSAGAGLVVRGSASVEATDLEVTGVYEAGLVVRGGGSRLELTGGSVSDTLPGSWGDGRGVEVQSGATLVATGTRVERNVDLGVHGHGDGTWIELEDVTIAATRPMASGDGGRGLHLWDGALLLGRRLVVEDNHEVGMVFTGEETAASLTDTTVRGTNPSIVPGSGPGIAIQAGADVSAVGLELRGNAGPGLYMTGDGWAFVQDGLFVQNGFAGAALLGAELALYDVTIEASAPMPGFGGGVGVFTWDLFGPPLLFCDGVELLDLPAGGLYLRGEGAFDVQDSDFVAAGTVAGVSAAVLATDGVGPWSDEPTPTGLRVAGSRFAELAGDAILLDGSGGTLQGDGFEAIGGLPLYRQRCDGAPDVELIDQDGVDGSCQPWSRPIVPLLGISITLEEGGVQER
jgi:hypothetical protein